MEPTPAAKPQTTRRTAPRGSGLIHAVLAGWLAGLMPCHTLHAGPLVDDLLAGYARIQSVSCEVVKDTESAQHSVKTLSRVFYERPDRLNVENISPLQRRIVSDGTNFFSYVPGDPKGFARPVAKLEADMVIPLRKVPGSPMEHLLRIRGVPEQVLPGLPEFPMRRGHAMTNTFVVLDMDASNRLARIEFFTDASCSNRTAQCEYSGFQEALPGVWLATLHRTTLTLGGLESHETSRYYKLSVNTPLSRDLFNPRLFFKDVSFVSSFDEIYKGL